MVLDSRTWHSIDWNTLGCTAFKLNLLHPLRPNHAATVKPAKVPQHLIKWPITRNRLTLRMDLLAEADGNGPTNYVRGWGFSKGRLCGAVYQYNVVATSQVTISDTLERSIRGQASLAVASSLHPQLLIRPDSLTTDTLASFDSTSSPSHILLRCSLLCSLSPLWPWLRQCSNVTRRTVPSSVGCIYCPR